MSKLVESGRPARVLLVEDSEGDITLFRRMFLRACPDAVLTVAHTAEAALILLQRADGTGNDPLPDLIITDLNLPGIDGVELVRALKRDQRFRRIPCIVLSSSQAAQDIAAAYDAFAAGYLTKPDTMDAYAAMIESLTGYWFTLMQVPNASDAPRRFAGLDTGFQHSGAIDS
jgi:two-component system, chemotaxis family, response regulator Rcp1